ncbi:hypothetical protein VF14_18040 [Nostoc linckia z18]|uniref:Uncharacterized protein n=2 Tax=Nostoc linckia TaxID=92942 RepID=A0A9Q6EKP3_NOSLI|nr:hypothetical protein [Nostoc linckia]PHK41229.1 hypothetical protein VF12_07560 [Nostoc linckia z15]PHK45193.1 hypothetical protein VF13_17510 [Nostoc linckia z16]PHJ62434.1 hypothetical protein VF02_17350 [Nostoc linckia z1]PHJ62508.1 hypothetical protein VF05_26485 [Nostoc linckia z3]PHJ71267.1 hypothetical protein VF03_20545 [Nostoc linckia z2]
MNSLLKIPSLLFGLIKSKSEKFEIECYGQSDSGQDAEQIQQIMEWLFASLMNAGYFGRSHLIWDLGDQDWKQIAVTGLLRDEPVFLYRCNDRPSLPPEHCCWRLMTEYPSLRIYQLEVLER